MNIARKIALTAAATALGTALIGLGAPAAHAGDSSWGCGGVCRGVPDDEAPAAPADDETDAPEAEATEAP